MTTMPDPSTEDGYEWVQPVALAANGVPFALRGFRDAPQFVILPGHVSRKRWRASCRWKPQASRTR